MITLNLKAPNKGRIWFEHNSSFEIETEANQVISLHSSPTQQCQPCHVSIEVCLRKGTRSIYGLLGGSFTYSSTTELQIILPTNEQDIDIPNDITFLANPPEIIRLGLPDEYAESIIRMYKDKTRSNHKYPSGQLVFNTAAHGAFTSNTWIFDILAEAVLDTICWLSHGQTDQSVVKAIIEKLNTL